MAIRSSAFRPQGNPGGQKWHDAEIGFSPVTLDTQFGLKASDYCLLRASHQPLDCATAAYLQSTPGLGLSAATPTTPYAGPTDVVATRPPQISRPPKRPPQLPQI